MCEVGCVCLHVCVRAIHPLHTYFKCSSEIDNPQFDRIWSVSKVLQTPTTLLVQPVRVMLVLLGTVVKHHLDTRVVLLKIKMYKCVNVCLIVKVNNVL